MIRSNTPISAYQKQVLKYLPEFKKFFSEKDEIDFQEFQDISEYSYSHSRKLLVIFVEFGWITSSEKDKYNRKKWNLSKIGKEMLKEQY